MNAIVIGNIIPLKRVSSSRQIIWIRVLWVVTWGLRLDVYWSTKKGAPRLRRPNVSIPVLILEMISIIPIEALLFSIFPYKLPFLSDCSLDIFQANALRGKYKPIFPRNAAVGWLVWRADFCQVGLWNLGAAIYDIPLISLILNLRRIFLYFQRYFSGDEWRLSIQTLFRRFWALAFSVVYNGRDFSPNN